MITIDIGGNQIQLEDSFLKLDPDAQNATVEHIAQSIGVTPPPPGPENSLAGSAKAVGSGLISGGAQTLGAPADIAGLLGAQGMEPYGAKNITKNIEDVTGPLYKPQTGLEKTLHGVSEFGVNALFPGGPIRRAANVVVPGLASEAAGALTDDNPIAKTAAALTGLVGVNKIGRAAEMAAAKAKMPVPPSTSEEVNAALPEMYGTKAIQSTEIKPQFAVEMADSIKDNAIASRRYSTKDPDVAKIYGIVEDMKTPEFGANHTMQDFENTRQVLNDQIIMSPSASKVSKDFAGKVRESIEKAISMTPDAAIISGDARQAALDLARARAQAFTGFKLAKVEQFLNDASIDAAKSHSGGNFQNILYQKIAPALKRPDRYLKGWTDQEIAALASVMPGRLESITRRAGNMMGGGGGLGAMVSAVAGSHALGPAGAVLPFVGQVLKGVGAGAAQGKLEKVKELIAAGAPGFEPYRRELERLSRRGGTFESLPKKTQLALQALIATHAND